MTDETVNVPVEIPVEVKVEVPAVAETPTVVETPAENPVITEPVIDAPSEVKVPEVVSVGFPLTSVGGIAMDFHAEKEVNGIKYHDVHLVDGTQYLFNESDFANWCS